MLIENQYLHNVVKYATQVRGAVTGIIFDKSMRLASTDNANVKSSSSITRRRKRKGLNENDETEGRQRSAQGLGVGGILNLMQTDASELENTALQLHTLWDGPLQVCTSVSLITEFL